MKLTVSKMRQLEQMLSREEISYSRMVELINEECRPKPIELINALRESDEYIKYIYTQGSCYRFHIFLKSIWPEAIPYINKTKDHIATRIGNSLYDINGETDGEEWEPLDNNLQIARCKEWSFYRQMMLKINECPFCEEEITFDEKDLIPKF